MHRVSSFQVNSPLELLEENADVHVLLGAKNWHLVEKNTHTHLITVIDYCLVTMITLLELLFKTILLYIIKTCYIAVPVTGFSVTHPCPYCHLHSAFRSHIPHHYHQWRIKYAWRHYRFAMHYKRHPSALCKQEGHPSTNKQHEHKTLIWTQMSKPKWNQSLNRSFHFVQLQDVTHKTETFQIERQQRHDSTTGEYVRTGQENLTNEKVTKIRENQFELVWIIFAH